MNKEYHKIYSNCLGREVEFKVYGHAGKPFIYIPCQDGRFFDFENFHMADVMSPWIESGEIFVVSLDTIDSETWSNFWGNAEYRSRLYEDWIQYIIKEIVPFIHDFDKRANGTGTSQGIISFGCSLGATHAANLYFRFPYIFDGVIGLSGIYDASYGFGTYSDDYVYLNNPVASLANMPTDHEYMDFYRKGRIVICCGQGAWECPDYTRRLDEILRSKGIPAWVDYWGYDVNHDWPWWYKQIKYFLPYVLGK